jgi:diguanylate cyclase (GGDEF)-like protein
LAVVPVVLALHLVHVVVMTTQASDGLPASEVRWRQLIALAHGCTALTSLLIGAYAVWLRRRPDGPPNNRLVAAVGTLFVGNYLLSSAVIAGIDQLVTPNITPYLVAVFATGTFLPIPVVPLTLLHVVSLVVFGFAINAFAPAGPAVLSNLLNGLTVALAGWAIARALRTARAKNSAQAMTIEEQKSVLATMNEDLQRLAHLDALTGLPNRRSLLERSEQMRAHAARHKEPLALLMIDVDHFKQVNDQLGHGRGDEVLIGIVGACMSQLRAEDLLGRIGGEEFAAILPQCTADGARIVAERMRHKVESLALPHPNGTHVTVCVGVSQVVPDAERAIDIALEAADGSLYEAKRSGRNRVGPIAAA